MSAVRTACLVEDNLAGEPRVFPKGQYEAMVSFRVLHTDRVPDPDTGEWKDGRTSAVTVEFRGARAERLARLIGERPDVFFRGRAVVAWGGGGRRPVRVPRPGRARLGRHRARGHEDRPRPADERASHCPLTGRDARRGPRGRYGPRGLFVALPDLWS